MPHLFTKLIVKRSFRFKYNSKFASDKSYESAIEKLNGLQTNAATVLKSSTEGPLSHIKQLKKVELTAKYLSRVGISLDRLDKISFMHIAGTKGKGTTAALCESILRKYGYRTGFFSSPHLVSVRERIRIDGVPLSEKKFTEYFNYIFSELEQKKECETDMPAYFKFMTVMAFHVFLSELVDVAIVEVGIGGEYDCTNIIRKPAVVGITSLGLDHTKILGKTLPDIAWQKSGVFKPGAMAFTAPQICPSAMDVLRVRANNRQCSLSVAPPLESYSWEKQSQSFSNSLEDVYSTNASLAVQMSNAWLKLQSPFIERNDVVNEESDVVPLAEPICITSKMAEGLSTCSWPGRTQVIKRNNVTYFIDGAHTEESLIYCTRWFTSASATLYEGPTRPKRILIFNVTGQRDVQQFLYILNSVNFDMALFTPIVPFKKNIPDQMDFNISKKKDLNNLSNIWEAVKHSNKSKIFEDVSEALEFISSTSNEESCHVLITGSVHLVGSALCNLDPSLSDPVFRVSATMRPLQSLYSTVQTLM